MELSWPDLLIAFAVCHLAGDYLLQTDRQARCKRGGLGRDRVARRALAGHVASYALAFAPVVVWLGTQAGAPLAVAAVLGIAVPHAVLDDGRVVSWWLRRVKRVGQSGERGLAPAVDQSLHAVSLWGTALLLAL